MLAYSKPRQRGLNNNLLLPVTLNCKWCAQSSDGKVKKVPKESQLYCPEKSRIYLYVLENISRGTQTQTQTHTHTHIYIYIYIERESSKESRVNKELVATSPCRSSPLAGLQCYIPYPHIAAGCMFELVILLLPGHMLGSIGVHHLWARPCFSSSDLHVWFV